MVLTSVQEKADALKPSFPKVSSAFNMSCSVCVSLVTGQHLKATEERMLD